MTNHLIKTTVVISFISSSIMAVDTSARYVNCMDYNTVGAGLCRADDPVPDGPKRADAPKIDMAKDFIENHGKPPRAFAEFYTNPTLENAQKWNQAYREQQMKAAEISRVWGAAIEQEKVLNPAPAQVAPQSVGVLPRKMEPTGYKPEQVLSRKPNVTPLRIGAFTTGAEMQGALTYYFSVSDPNSAKMSANLNAIYSSGKSKYKFTCVDLTPLSDKFQAIPANRGSLPCDWRMPRAGELESLKIQQTPVLVIQRPNTQPRHIAGVIETQQILNMLR